MPRFSMYPLRNNNVLEVYGQRELINLEPAYQRLSVWDTRKQQLFIDSVINGFDVPKLYFHELPRVEEGQGPFKYAVIDGKQRLLALWAFIDNRLRLASNFVYFDNETVKAGGATYRDLLEKFPILRAQFDGFDLPIVLVHTDDEFFIEDLFSRLNIAVALSAAEYRNSLGGPMPLLIKRVALTPFFSESIERRIRNDRYQHLDLAAKFLYLTRHPGFQSTKKATLDNFVSSYRQARQEGKEIASREALSELEANTKEILDEMHVFFDHSDALLSSVGRVTLYFHLFRIHRTRGVEMTLSKPVLETFNAQVVSARLKSQRMGGGSGEILTADEQTLVSFDREKQSVNDGGALQRQYGYLSAYLSNTSGIQLPEPV